MLRKERELGDAKARTRADRREEIQENLVAVRDKAKLEAEDALKAKSPKRRSRLPACSARSRRCAARPNRDLNSCRARRSSLSWNPCCAPAFRMIGSSRCRKASSVAMFSTAWSARSSGSPSALGTGSTAGCQSCVTRRQGRNRPSCLERTAEGHRDIRSGR